ncbi:unnamed protein product [Aureobasidium pullulans]|nr:unnamed protein product [Aureobasidium pullulans]
MPESNTETTVYTSRNFSINCGGVIHDPDKDLYLILANRVGASGDISYSYKLPKGQKTETEDLLATAIRETRRETGVTTTSMALPPDLAEEDMDIDDDDEEIIPGEDIRERQQQRGKQRSPIWVTEDEALELLSKEDDKEVIKQMAGLLRVKKTWEQLRDERDY